MNYIRIVMPDDAPNGVQAANSVRFFAVGDDGADVELQCVTAARIIFTPTEPVRVQLEMVALDLPKEFRALYDEGEKDDEAEPNP